MNNKWAQVHQLQGFADEEKYTAVIPLPPKWPVLNHISATTRSVNSYRIGALLRPSAVICISLGGCKQIYYFSNLCHNHSKTVHGGHCHSSNSPFISNGSTSGRAPGVIIYSLVSIYHLFTVFIYPSSMIDFCTKLNRPLPPIHRIAVLSLLYIKLDTENLKVPPIRKPAVGLCTLSASLNAHILYRRPLRHLQAGWILQINW